MASLVDLIIGSGKKSASDIIGSTVPGATKRAVDTVQIKKQYDAANIEAQSNGESFPDWPTWLDQQGYTVDAKGLVLPKSK